MCPVDDFRETYQYVSVKLAYFNIEPLLEKRLSMHYRDIQPEATNRIAEHIESKAGGNITLALLYLEDVFTRDEVATFNIDRIDDRLPRDVIAYFDTEMSFIERKPEPERLPPLHAIAVAAHHSNGISLEELEQCISLAQRTCLSIDYPRSVEDVFTAANGWLTDLRTVDRKVDICCQPAFPLYVKEKYNDSLERARRRVDSAAEGRPGAVLSHQFQETSSSDQTPDLLGSTFDTLASERPLLTPLTSLEHSLGIREPEDTYDRTLFLDKDDELVQSPPRMNSAEYVPGMSRGIFQDHEPRRKVTQAETASKQSPMGVCDFCISSVLDSAASSGQHRASIDGANIALNQCTFCTSLYANMEHFLSNTEDWPLYHWTLRALPRGRELRGSMMLRFRSSHPKFTTKSFRFLPGNDLHVPAPEDLSETTDPELSGGTQINKWMDTCMRDHQDCSNYWQDQRSKPSFLPTRLLDVDTGDDKVIRLVDTKTTKAKGPYCTLSHAWGPREKPFLTTTVWNMAKHLITGITLDELPRNFQHAIHVTRFLKVRYIWIDSLAIVQEPLGDFAKEADLMHRVYRYSHCNIVAADSKDAYGGLFRTRKPHEILPVTYQGTDARHHLGEKSWTIVPADLWEKELLSSIIYGRAWVFQERILSPRILHFTKRQIFWDCGTLSACEVFPKGLPFPLDHEASTDRHWRGRLARSTVSSNALVGVIDNESSYTFWMSAVQNYTECELTNQGDKTIAIWSIAKLLRDFMSEQYAVGMWSGALEEQLTWRVRDTKACKRMPELDANIPSWSWASIKGAVVPQHRLAKRPYKITDHDGAAVRFTVKEETRQGDKEPILESRTLALKAHINFGRLVKGQEDQYRLHFPSKISTDTVEVDAFLDTPLATTCIDPEHCAFIILAASATPNPTNTPHLPQPSSPKARQTYSGVGLLLIKHTSWISGQERLYQEYKSALAGVEPSREQRWRLDAFEKLMLQQSERIMKMGGKIGSVYRRMGALQFRDMDERAFNEMTDARHREDIWLE
ncbi:uncharacterized protein J4E88_003945 [Alternaria novae-zelandiae]|uniref:uncharacterized protein n=1 Tax=Alternaria novae-zelandiae TaxID=430562 RepID=UPI0020C2C8B9|nr:uncharacterized protein J4E88_003945 [Alternaria novae-zelandiae]KAI4686108.1 hypothetical protein J4E88_003945 [Alternaria novae-zelandiae]